MRAIEQAVRSVGRELPRAAVLRRRDLLAEIRDGLEDATEQYQARGLSETEAQRRAVADFGDPRAAGRELAETLVASATRRAATVLGPGYLLMLCGWAVFGRGGAAPASIVQATAGASFAWIAIAALAVAGSALLLGRRRSSLLAARLVGLCGVVVALGTWVASYLVAPWPSLPTHLLAEISPLEAVSLLTTSTILLCSSYCLWLAATTAPRLTAAVRP